MIAGIARRLMIRAVIAAMTPTVGHAVAQSVFPAPLPGQASAPAHADSAPVATGGPSDGCKGFFPLREEAERRGQRIKAAAERHAAREEACVLIQAFGQTELEMIDYVEAHSATCQIPPRAADMLKAAHKKTEALQLKVCTDERLGSVSLGDVLGPPRKEPAGPLGDFEMPR